MIFKNVAIKWIDVTGFKDTFNSIEEIREKCSPFVVLTAGFLLAEDENYVWICDTINNPDSEDSMEFEGCTIIPKAVIIEVEGINGSKKEAENE